MTEVSIYHNPRCSKSREALALLESRGIAPRVIAYVEAGLQEPELRALLAKLGIPARELLRTSEAAYRERGLADPALSEAELIRAMCEEPRLMQRPIVVRGKRAVVARPAERALELLA
jgi:arsenate reductase (glutaredoxin)